MDRNFAKKQAFSGLKKHCREGKTALERKKGLKKIKSLIFFKKWYIITSITQKQVCAIQRQAAHE